MRDRFEAAAQTLITAKNAAVHRYNTQLSKSPE
jgi:hypothetical protein